MSAVNVFETTDSSAVRWPLHAAFAVTLAGFCAFYAQTFSSLISIWASTGRYEYAFLIFPVSAVLVWLRRNDLKHYSAAPAPLGLIALGLLCLLWLAGAAAHVNLATQFSVIAMIPCLVFTFYGTVITRTLIFPLAYLFFAVPFGNFLVGPLQDITARLSVAALQWTPVPVFLDGHYIMTPAGTWHVAEACSGVSFFFATTAFGVLYANLFFQRWRRRLLFVALALATPIIANGLRVFFTILIGEYFGMQYATGTDHMIFGWQFFGTVTVLLFLAGWPWHQTQRPNGPYPASAGVDTGGMSGARTWTVLVASLIMLAIAPLWMAVSRTSVKPTTVEITALPDALDGLPYMGPIASSSVAGLGTAFPTSGGIVRARYGTADHFVNVIVAQYTGVSSGDNELVVFGNRLFKDPLWEVTNDRNVPVGAFQELKLVRQSGTEDSWLLWYFYRVGDQTAVTKGMLKFWRAWYRLWGRSVSARAVVLATPIALDEIAARRRMQMAARALLHWLDEKRSGGYS